MSVLNELIQILTVNSINQIKINVNYVHQGISYLKIISIVYKIQLVLLVVFNIKTIFALNVNNNTTYLIVYVQKYLNYDKFQIVSFMIRIYYALNVIVLIIYQMNSVYYQKRKIVKLLKINENVLLVKKDSVYKRVQMEINVFNYKMNFVLLLVQIFHLIVYSVKIDIIP